MLCASDVELIRLQNTGMEDEHAPLLGAPVLPELERFMHDDLFKGTATATYQDLTEVRQSEDSALVELRGVPHFMSIPEVPSASARWNSHQMTAKFTTLLGLSILQLVTSFAWIFIYYMIGFFRLSAAVIGLVACSFYLCNACQSVVMDANIAMVR
jgi:hypothetical protein